MSPTDRLQDEQKIAESANAPGGTPWTVSKNYARRLEGGAEPSAQTNRQLVSSRRNPG